MIRATLAALILGGLAAPAAHAQTFAITGGTVLPVSGPRIERGTVIIKDGRVVAVGADVPIPAGAQQIDATGKWVTPGLIHPASNLGVAQFGSGAVNETRDNLHQGDVNPSFSLVEAIEPGSITIPVGRLGGITSAVVIPQGGLISGQAVAFDLYGDRVEEMVTRVPAAMVIRLGIASKGAGGGSRAGSLQRLRRIFRDAREYERRPEDFRKAQIQPLAASEDDLAALLPVLRGEVPVLFVADRQSDIESALRLAREFNLRVIISGGAEAWKVAGQLAAARVPVALQPLSDIPTFNALEPRLDNAALLRKAGVPVLIAQGDNSFGSDLRFAAGNAVANGMSWDDALAAMTLWPAEAYGIADRYGSLQAGRVANLVVWSGDPLEYSSAPVQLFIRGRPVPLVSRQTELLSRYRNP